MREPVIGLEIHLAVRTDTKLFCGCPASGFGLEPNVNTCPVCLGLPGSLPVVNRAAIEKAVRFALGLGCRVPERTQFHRKNYYYPDAPKNYQISQFDRPVGEGGVLRVRVGDGERAVGITRCHLEEDAGRLVHPSYAPYSLVDLNRAGTPLIEMVTEPDLRAPEEARVFLTEVRAIARALDVSDASPEEGKMRADVNVSLRNPDGSLGTKVEVKNLNSFRSVQSALEFEIQRQRALLDDGGAVRQETRGWNEGGQRTYPMRGKEESADYRYLPDPDLPPLNLERAWLERVREAMPELPAAKRARYLAMGLRESDADLIAFDVEAARFLDAAVERYGGGVQTLANWLNGDVAGHLNAAGRRLGESALTPEALVRLVALVDRGEVSGKTAKDILPEVMAGGDPDGIVEARGLGQITDEGAVGALVDEVIRANPEVVASIETNPKAVNALLGRVMQQSRGKAKPDLVRRLLGERLKPTPQD